MMTPKQQYKLGWKILRECQYPKKDWIKALRRFRSAGIADAVILNLMYTATNKDDEPTGWVNQDRLDVWNGDAYYA